MKTASNLEMNSPIKLKMDDEKKQLVYKIMFNVCSTAAVVGIPYLFYQAAVHFF